MTLIKTKYFSIKAKLLILSIFVLSILFLGLPFFSIQFFENELKDIAIEEIERKIEIISVLHYEFLKNKDTSSSISQLIQFENYSNVLACTIYDKNGDLFSEYKKNTLINSKSSIPLKNNFVERNKSIEITRRIINYDKELMGAINFVISLEQIQTKIEEIKNKIFIIRIILFSIAMFIYFIIINNILKPISILNRTISDIINKNDFSRKLDNNYKGELAELADNFNSIKELLLKSIKENEKNRSTYSSFLKAIPFGVSAYDKNRIFLYANDAYCDIYKIKDSKILVGSKLFSRIDNPKEKEQVISDFENISENISTKHLETMILRYDNTTANIKMNILIERDSSNDITSYVIITTDISENIELEKELNIVSNEMNNIAKTRTSELEHQLDSFKQNQNQIIQNEKLKALGSLVTGIAHELNTPLGVGISLTSNIAEKAEIMNELKNNFEQNEIIDFINLIHESSSIILKNLKKVASQVKLFKTIATDKNTEPKKRFNISDTLKNIISQYKNNLQIDGHKIFVTCDKDLEINSYYSIFYQIISNLVKNSILHGFENTTKGVIKIIVKKENDNLIIIFSDNGKGIPITLYNKILEPFYTTKRGEGSIGLGLYIVFNLVNSKLKGKISFNQMISNGIECTISFPL